MTKNSNSRATTRITARIRSLAAILALILTTAIAPFTAQAQITTLSVHNTIYDAGQNQPSSSHADWDWNASTNTFTLTGDGVTQGIRFYGGTGDVTFVVSGNRTVGDGIQNNAGKLTVSGSGGDVLNVSYSGVALGGLYGMEIIGLTVNATAQGSGTAVNVGPGDFTMSSGTLNLTASGNGDGLLVGEDPESGSITISGTATVTTTAPTGSYAIFATGDITIDGGATVNVESSGNSGIYAPNLLTINGGSVTATAASNNYPALQGTTGINITGGNVHAIANGNHRGISSDGNINISGGTVAADANGSGGSADGIYALGSTSINITGNASVTTTGSAANSGIRVSGGTLTINTSGTVTAVGRNAIIGDNINIISGTVNATGNGTSGYGIYAGNGNISISGGSVTATGAGNAGSALLAKTGIALSGNANVVASNPDGLNTAIITYSGDLTVSDGASLNSTPIPYSDIAVLGGNILINTTGTVTAQGVDGFPTVSADGTSIQNGTVGVTGDVSGDLTVSGGTVTVTGTVGGTTTHTGGTLNGNTPPPVTVPGAPTAVTATAGDGQATVSFTAPADNGGAAITGYTVTSSPGDITATGAASPITVTGLTNGTAYTFTVTAINSVGTGLASASSNAITPVATVPVTMVVTFDSNGGSAVSQQQVAAGATATQPANPIRAGYTFAGWKNGSTTYDFSTPVTENITLTAQWEAASTTGIDDVETVRAPSLHPNPFTGIVHLTGAEGSVLQVITVNGVIVHTQKVENPDETINLEQLPAGMYLFRLEKDGKAKTIKGVRN
ncbi:MAG: InlB B-repeat-containing protein [Bacteroidales bacterium]|jgi:uncharacterized repeat protein (TIGR02543 family)|nr:InlB B-repeat-containing protein [Bacteroidales bacterium]